MLYYTIKIYNPNKIIYSESILDEKIYGLINFNKIINGEEYFNNEMSIISFNIYTNIDYNRKDETQIEKDLNYWNDVDNYIYDIYKTYNKFPYSKDEREKYLFMTIAYDNNDYDIVRNDIYILYELYNTTIEIFKIDHWH